MGDNDEHSDYFCYGPGFEQLKLEAWASGDFSKHISHKMQTMQSQLQGLIPSNSENSHNIRTSCDRFYTAHHERSLSLVRIQKEQQAQKREQDLHVSEHEEHQPKKRKSNPQHPSSTLLNPDRPRENNPTYYKTAEEALQDTVNGGPFGYIEDERSQVSLKQILETKNYAYLINKKVLMAIGKSGKCWRVGNVLSFTPSKVKRHKGSVNITVDMVITYYTTASNNMYYEDIPNLEIKRKTWLAVLFSAKDT
jgi:guanyl-specific ribonuclease Sa